MRKLENSKVIKLLTLKFGLGSEFSKVKIHQGKPKSSTKSTNQAINGIN